MVASLQAKVTLTLMNKGRQLALHHNMMQYYFAYFIG